MEQRRITKPARTDVEWERLQHELEVHQEELELQNESLLAIQDDLSTALERYTDLYDFAPVGYLSLGRGGEIRQLNLAAATLLGGDRARLVKRRLGQFVAQPNRVAFADFLEGVFAGQHPGACEMSLGECGAPALVVRLDIASRPSGQECLVVLIDITEQTHADDEVRRQAALISSLLDSIPDIVFFKNTEGVYLGCNPACVEFVGRPRNEIIGKSDGDLFEREIGDAFQEQDHRMLAKRALRRNEEWITYPDGRKALVDTLKAPYWGPDGELIGVLGISRDITAQRKAEDALRGINETLEERVAGRTAQLREKAQLLEESEARLRATMESIGDGFLVCDVGWRFVHVNVPAERLLGSGRKKVLGKSLWEVFRITPGTRLEREYRRAAAGEPRSFEHFHKPWGRWCHNRCFPREGGGIVIYLIDLTERKRLEQNILDISEREQQRIGHEMHDGLGQQLHGLSYLAVLLEKGLLAEGSPSAAEAGRLNKYLTEALKMTRDLAHGLQPVKLLPQGLMAALRELAEHTRDLYGMDCRFACPAPVLVHSHSAANHLYRIAQEAVNNSMKHAKSTRVHLRLAAAGQKITLSVRDNGVGFHPQTDPGRGMGLQVMQYRANAIGGSLHIRQTPRGGTEAVCTVTGEALLPQTDKLQ